ncbi:MAG: hypothetical protein ACOCUH_01550 [Bacteriovoracia bacterium]
MRTYTLEIKTAADKILVKKCHVCGEVIESLKEPSKCGSCGKAFLPLHYFEKIHDVKTSDDFMNLFEYCDALHDEDLIKGLQVLW